MALKALMRIFGLKKEEKKTERAPRRQQFQGAPVTPLRGAVTPARCHPNDVSDEQATEIRRPPRVHPYDDVSDEQLNEKRRTQRVHPYDEVSDEQLNQNRRTPRVHPYDEVSDAVLEQNRLSRPARRHEYDEVDLEPGMARVKDSAE